VTNAQRAALARNQQRQRHLLGLLAGVLDYSGALERGGELLLRDLDGALSAPHRLDSRSMSGDSTKLAR
jgi:hypothetical protein